MGWGGEFWKTLYVIEFEGLWQNLLALGYSNVPSGMYLLLKIIESWIGNKT